MTPHRRFLAEGFEFKVRVFSSLGTGGGFKGRKWLGAGDVGGQFHVAGLNGFIHRGLRKGFRASSNRMHSSTP